MNDYLDTVVLPVAVVFSDASSFCILSASAEILETSAFNAALSAFDTARAAFNCSISACCSWMAFVSTGTTVA
ncbi:hypothetical protein D3C87_1815440 [compost metagenome]